MKKAVIKVIGFSLILLCLAATAYADYVVSVLGPKVYQRTTGAPNVFQENFKAQPGPALLEIFNGSSNGANCVTSAQVLLNGQKVLGPDKFKKKVSLLQAPIQLTEANSLSVSLQSAPGSLFSLRITREIPFEQETPGRVKADLAVDSLTLTPDRCQPDAAMTFHAVVVNQGPEATPPCTLVFQVGGSELRRVPVPGLSAQTSQGFSFSWSAPGPGRHLVSARLELGQEIMDPNTGNNFLQATLRVSGELYPVPELEFGQVEFSPWPLEPGQPATVSLNVRNPSFVPLSNVMVSLFLDDVPLGSGPDAGGGILEAIRRLYGAGGDEARIYGVLIPFLGPDMSTRVEFPWQEVTAGQHVLRARLSQVPDLFPPDQRTMTWNVTLPAATKLYQPPQGSNKWVSLGPSTMEHITFGGDDPVLGKDPWSGKLNCLALNPKTIKPFTAYAGGKNYYPGPSGAGLWTSTDSGTSWQPLTDQLFQMGINAVAVDPEQVDTVYCASGEWFEKIPVVAALPGTPKPIKGPIFKSLDGGKNWQLFGHPAEGYSKLVVRYTSSGEVVVYAASNRGLLRYKSGAPLATSDQGAWQNILPYPIGDLVVHPTNPDIVYAVPYAVSKKDGKEYFTPFEPCRTTRGTSLNPDSEPYPSGWNALPLLSSIEPNPSNRIGWRLNLDLYRSNPKKVYVSVQRYSDWLEIHQSPDAGATWKMLLKNNKDIGGASRFLRVHPTIDNYVYYGYVNFWYAWKDFAGAWQTTKIPDIHADVHDMQFHPTSDYFLVAGDGGVYWGVQLYDPLHGLLFPKVIGLNNGLRNAQIYDFDVCQYDTEVMLAGTQDEGNLKYLPGTGDKWKGVVLKDYPVSATQKMDINFGDGMFCLISPDKNIQYCQYIKGIKSTCVSFDQGNNFKERQHAGLNYNGSWEEQSIAVDPLDPLHVLAQGWSVQESLDGCDSWNLAGPPSVINFDGGFRMRHGNIRRVVFHPSNKGEWFAGTDMAGEIWFRSSGGDWSLKNLIFAHDDSDARVASMAFAPPDPSVLYVSFDRVQKDRRLLRLKRNDDGTFTSEYIGSNLPVRHVPSQTPVLIRCLVGDPYLSNVVYVGTDKGVFRGEEIAGEYGSFWTWQPYNDGLPLVDVRKLIPIRNTGELRAGTMGRGLWAVNVATVE